MDDSRSTFRISANDAQRDLLAHEVFESAPDTVIEVGADGKIIYANSKVASLFGYLPAELEGQPVEILIPPELRGQHEAQRGSFFRNARSRGMGSGVPFSAQRKDGSRFAADVALASLKNDDGRGGRMLAFVRDVTHLRQVETAERELREKTLLAMVDTLSRLLSFSSPLIFERSRSMGQIVTHLAQGRSPEESWQLRLAGALCLIGCVSVPPAIFEKVWSGQKVSPEEGRLYAAHAPVGEKLISSIPRLETVAEIVGKQQSNVPEPGFVADAVRMLKLARRFDRLLFQRRSVAESVLELRRTQDGVPREWMSLLETYVPAGDRQEAKSITPAELQPGMVLDEDVSLKSGLLIALRDTRLNAVLIERVQNFIRQEGTRARIRVRMTSA